MATANFFPQQDQQTQQQMLATALMQQQALQQPFPQANQPLNSGSSGTPSLGGGLLAGLGTYYSGLGGTKVDANGNAKMTDMFGLNIGDGGQKVHHDNSNLQAPGAAIGGIIGNATPLGPLGGALGTAAGRNAGQTVGDVAGGNWSGIGADISQNLPPGFQDKGTGGVVNGITGLPLSKIFKWF